MDSAKNEVLGAIEINGARGIPSLQTSGTKVAERRVVVVQSELAGIPKRVVGLGHDERLSI